MHRICGYFADHAMICGIGGLCWSCNVCITRYSFKGKQRWRKGVDVVLVLGRFINMICEDLFILH